MPQWLASTIGRIPTASSQLLFSIPGKMGTALGMSHLIAHNQVKQREMLDSVDKFVVLTEWALQAALSNDLPAEKFSLNRLGLSQDIVFRKPSPEHKPTGQPVKVGYLGRFEHVKGVVELARSIASLGRDVPVEVEFRGPVKSGPEQGIVNEIKRIVGDDPRVTFAPPVSAVEVLDVLAAYDVLCCPSVCLEGGPTVAIEAHAVGTPVIGSRIGGLAELVTDGVNGKLVEPGDWQALASLITEIATDPAGTIDSWRRFLPSARTMDEITADYLSLYSSLKPATSLR
jgi:glycosyltransferase involved in cell wall biosynthesis